MYENEANLSDIKDMARTIRIIDEDTEQDIENYGIYLNSSHHVYIMGFAYHEDALKKLGYFFSKNNIKPNPIIKGTRYGLKDLEVKRISEKFPMIEFSSENHDCLNFLRESAGFHLENSPSKSVMW